MSTDPFEAIKQAQREMWASFAPLALFTTPVAAHLVGFAGIAPGEAVLDVGTGTGVVAITAARAGARVSALDLTPALLEDARVNAGIAGMDAIDWREGDAESLPHPDASFDVVLSQFGHMFAPRPERAVGEMRRVLKPGGRVAFATWPPDHFMGRMFTFVARHAPPPPAGASPPTLWGDPQVVADRLAAGFEAPTFGRGTLHVPALSLAHYRLVMERSAGPVRKLVDSLARDPVALGTMRAAFDALAAPHFEGNCVNSEYLLTRASAR